MPTRKRLKEMCWEAAQRVAEAACAPERLPKRNAPRRVAEAEPSAPPADLPTHDAPTPAEVPPTPVEATHKTSGRRGRFNPNIDWDLGKHLFSKGELLRRGNGLLPKTVYPSYSEIAGRIGTTKQNVQKHAERHRWSEAREKFANVVEQKIDEVTANSRARLIAEPLQIVDEYINDFVGALREGKVRVDAATDLDKMVRLRAFLTEREHEKAQQKQVVSLEQMSAKHRAMRQATLRVDTDDLLSGVLAGDDPQTLAMAEDDESEEGSTPDEEHAA